MTSLALNVSPAADDNDQVQERTRDLLYPGDHSDWPLEARQVLVQLMRGPSLDERKHPNLWKVLHRWLPQLRVVLSHMLLELVVDSDSGVAYTQQADTLDLDAPKLLREKRLTFIESLVLLYLRQKLTEADAQGERAVVSADAIVEQMTVFSNRNSSDYAGFMNKVNAAIEKLKEGHFLNRIRDTDRFEVSPTLKLLLSVERVKELTALYNTLGPTGLKLVAANEEQTESREDAE